MQYRKVKYVGLEVDGRTFMIDFESMIVEERLEKDGNWLAIDDARFNWCVEGGYVFDEDNQFIPKEVSKSG